MKIGKLVKQHIKKIFLHCDNTDHAEINALLDGKKSKQRFGLNFPFCLEIKNIDQNHSKRYWTEIYLVRGKRVRVTSQWFGKNAPLFTKYLESKGIAPESDLPKSECNKDTVENKIQGLPSLDKSNSRYRGNHIGNAQNLFIRNILSSLGLESFSKKDWNSAKDYFLGKCAYCGSGAELLMEHAIPINKDKLGEHRLGNLVPSCKSCNSRKGDKDFRVFLAEKPIFLRNIESYMNTKNYVPLEDNEQMKKILDMAHKEIAALANRYITIINELYSQSSNA